METNVMNVSLAGVLRLDISDRELALTYKSAPRKDYEIREFAFIPFQEALDELLNPTREYHPTAGYRMLLALYNTYGPLKMIHRLMG